MDLYLEVLRSGVEKKFRNAQGCVQDLFFGVDNISSLYLVTHLPPYKSLDPCILKILDARQCRQCSKPIRNRQVPLFGQNR